MNKQINKMSNDVLFISPAGVTVFTNVSGLEILIYSVNNIFTSPNEMEINIIVINNMQTCVLNNNGGPDRPEDEISSYNHDKEEMYKITYTHINKTF